MRSRFGACGRSGEELLGNDVAASAEVLREVFELRQPVLHGEHLLAVVDVESGVVRLIGGLRQLSDDLPKESGLSIAQCEFWSDTLDRWAEDLVDPAAGGT